MCESEDLDRIRQYIGRVRWQYAKTMPTCPHEYTVRKWNPDLDADFVFFAEYIRRAGYQARWKRYKHTYLDLDGFKYWTMGAPIDQTIIINREALKE